MGRKKIAIEKIQDSRLRIVSINQYISSRIFGLLFMDQEVQIYLFEWFHFEKISNVIKNSVPFLMKLK